MIWQFSPSVPPRERPPKPERTLVVPQELQHLQSALDAIPNTAENSLDYDAWRDVLFAIHHATQGSDEGLELAHAFSSRSPKYDPEFLDNRFWPYAGKRGGEIITERTLYAKAAEHGWQDPTIADDFEVITEAPAQKKAKGRFQFVQAAAFSAGEPPGWIIKNVLPRQELIVVYGESGAGKSFITLDMLGHIALGHEWRGHKVAQGLTCAYIAAEGAAGFRNRLRALSEHNKIALDQLPLAVMAGAPNFMEKDDIIDLGNAMRTYGKLDVLVVDTLAQVTAGANENSGEDMGRVIAHCKTLHAVTGATVILVHHSGKDASRGARGWSGIKGALDAELEVTRSGEERVLAVTKLKDGQGEGQQFAFRLVDVPLGMDEDGEVFGSCVVEHIAALPRGRMLPPKGANERLALRMLEELAGVSEEAVHHSELVAACVDQMIHDAGSGKRDRRREIVVRAIESLREAGRIEVSGTELRIAE